MPRLKQKRTVDNSELLARLTTMSYDEIEKRLASGDDDAGLIRLVGYDAAKAIQQTAALPRECSPGDAAVLLPGVMGSMLLSTHGTIELLWINPLLFLNGNGGYLAGDPAVPEIDAVPFSLEKLSYTKIVMQLRQRYPVFEFPYDWRMPVEQAVAQLQACLERWAAANPDKRFTLIGHSMGGVVIRAYLARHAAWAEQHVKRAITLGAPYLGAPSMIENLCLGNSMCATMDKLNPKNNLQKVLLTMPGIYQLLPVPPELFPSGQDYPANWNLYDSGDWHLDGLRQPFLDATRAFHTFTAQQDPQVELIQIAGCNLPTTISLTQTFTPTETPQFSLAKSNEGDNTVPYWSAVSCGARVYYIQEVHRDLPNNSKVIQAVMDLIETGACALPNQPPPKSIWPFEVAFDAGVTAEVQAGALREKALSGTLARADLEKFYFAG
jgi:pimeloyl-ACP methyl ester carboxylesterase